MINLERYAEEFNADLINFTKITENGITIGENFTRELCQVLHEMDEEAYKEQLQDFIDRKKSEYSEIICQSFPAPTAYFYYKAMKDYENDLQRLHLLRDSWESIIYLLFAFVIGEVNHRSFNINEVRIFSGQRIQISSRGLLGFNLGYKLEVIGKIIEYDNSNEKKLIISQIINSEHIEVLKGLINERNSFSHIAALGTEEARGRFNELIETVTDLLFRLNFLENISILKYIDNGGNAFDARFSRFTGHSLLKHNFSHTFTNTELTQVAHLLRSDTILFEYNGIYFNVSPYIYFHLEGDNVRLCYFKQSSNDQETFTYEIIGGGQERELTIDSSSIIHNINNSLRGLL